MIQYSSQTKLFTKKKFSKAWSVAIAAEIMQKRKKYGERRGRKTLLECRMGKNNKEDKNISTSKNNKK